MIKEALEYLREQFKQTEFYEKNGELYVNVDLMKVTEPHRHEIVSHSLTSIVDFTSDNFDKDERLLITILDEGKVVVETELNSNKNRETVLVARADIPEKRLNAYLDMERFNIQLQSQFVPNEDSSKILSIIGNLRSENVKNVGDDGISQAVTVKKGVTIANEEVVPNPVHLKPFRTFTEIAQPESPFVFRLRNAGDEVEAALYEADGGAWRNQARLSIKEYLKDYLAEEVGTGKVLIIG
ncbi:hypothetical protein [Salinicoccus roseus]|uniref:Phage protein n=1 Tax=Salinicoccus roseus TaxID=45670 RepID=A0A0C2H897_9STAP|nr:hypothetical protein [Salinicoccus roseus]KIH70055.1 hypothetical protein SN16_11170 [Salinicoccus roseus]MDB0581363.1 hypothetical protein [Salinicoccus roseus]